MPRTLSIGGITYDLFVDIHGDVVRSADGRAMLQLPLGSKIRIQGVEGLCGGGASNTAVGLARLGCQSLCCGVTGSDQWGAELLKNLEREHVDAAATTVVEGEHSSFSIVIIADGDRVILNTPGTNAHLHDVTFDRSAAESADWVYLNHLHSASNDIEDDIVALLASARPPHVTWNPGGHQIRSGLARTENRALVAQTDLLILNKEEALGFTKATNIADAFAVLLQAGAHIVCITDGRNGADAVDGTHRYHCPVLPCTVRDATGAGDAFGTGMTWALLSGLDLPTALRAGTINATSVLGVIGAQPGLLTKTQMKSAIVKTPPVVTSTPL